MSVNVATQTSGAAEAQQPPAQFENCLTPLLDALNWHGPERHFKEALPHFSDIASANMFCDVMHHLNYDYSSTRVKFNNIDTRLLPCLYITEENAVFVLLGQEGDQLRVFDGAQNTERSLDITDVPKDLLKGTVYVFKVLTFDELTNKARKNWLSKVFADNKKMIYNALLFSFVLNLLALASPLFIMSVYDRVIGAASYSMLFEFVIGIGIAIAGIAFISAIRAKLLALIGARFDRKIGNNIFERLLYLSPVYTESATVGSQVARIRDFDRLREFLSGPLLSVLFEVPFIFISIAIIAMLSGTLVIVPLTMIAVYALLGLIVTIKIKNKVSESSRAGARQQEFLIETIKSMRALKYTAAQYTWQKRYRDLSANSTLANVKLSNITAINSAISDVVMIGAGMAVLSVGAIKVIDASISIGALIAVMILIWRVLAPLKTLFNTLPRLQQIANSLKQINRLMNIPPESQPSDVINTHSRQLRGNITFSRVSFRFNSAYHPTLIGVNFTIKAGDAVAIIGRNGSGKSTALKLLLGLYQPQAGSVFIDNQDIRQFNPIELRNLIGYLSQNPELFYGSIAANLRLANPTATDEDLRHAAKQAGILDDIMRLPKGFNDQIRDNSASQLASSFQQSLCLARAYLRKSSILLLDEPGTMLDNEGDARLMETIDELRGKVTIVMITHRPSHLKKMDQIILLEQGQLAIQGPPDKVLPKIPKELL